MDHAAYHAMELLHRILGSSCINKDQQHLLTRSIINNTVSHKNPVSSTMQPTTYLLVSAILPLISATSTPCLQVPACPQKGTITYDKAMPDPVAFPLTQVDLCYDDSAIQITFTAYNETNFYFNKSYGTNDPIYEYEVMEAFIYHGTNDPKTYMEFEIAPNNVTFNAFIYNPSKVRADDASFDTLYIQTPIEDGILGKTTLDKEKETWVSDVSIPLGFFNVDDGEAKGTKWRMNFVSPFPVIDVCLQLTKQSSALW